MLAIIGGSGLYSPGDGFACEESLMPETPYGEISAEILVGRWHGTPLAFLPRHGPRHRIPPHRINYRANLWALAQFGVSRVIAVNAVGGITPDLPPRTLALPDQIIDYTSGREHSFDVAADEPVRHVDFSYPYSDALRSALVAAARQEGVALVEAGTYGVTNGPRLESAAEIERLRRDGCNMVGMTGMPEAGLARELELDYACLALVVNWAAGVADGVIEMSEIVAHMEHGMQRARSVLIATARMVAA